jgi:hypothetical protein
VRADYTRLEAVEGERLVWRQELEESPFERILALAVTTLELHPADARTHVTIELEQKPRGWARFAPLQFRAAGARQVQGAIDGLRRLWDEGD